MGKFNTDCCPVIPGAPNAESSGTLTGGSYTVPAGAKSTTLIIHSGPGVQVSGEVSAAFTWAGTTRSWDATATGGTDASYANPFNFVAIAANTVWEVNYQL